MVADDLGHNGAATAAGQTDSESIAVSRTAVNDAPRLSQPDGALAYTEDTPTENAAVAIAPDLTATDPDSANATSATIKITGGYASGQDVLAYSGPLTASLNGAGDTLTLSGAATIADYQTALRAVTYANTSDNPNTAQRTVEFQLTDSDSAASAAVTRTIDLTATNDAPTVTTSAGFAIWTGAAVFVDSAVQIADVDSPELSRVTVTITSNFDSAHDSSPTPPRTASRAATTRATGVLTLTPVSPATTASVANFQAAAREVKFNSGGPNPAPSRTITFIARDSSGSENPDTAACHRTVELN